mmetsp:Transcript_114084/g.170628  ORF Transcript_114084/g.170628 Transcript_114084/m.170628 type:complete len:218 (-) Transcript_114084:249-902(-)
MEPRADGRSGVIMAQLRGSVLQHKRNDILHHGVEADGEKKLDAELLCGEEPERKQDRVDVEENVGGESCAEVEPRKARVVEDAAGLARTEEKTREQRHEDHPHPGDARHMCARGLHDDGRHHVAATHQAAPEERGSPHRQQLAPVHEEKVSEHLHQTAQVRAEHDQHSERAVDQSGTQLVKGFSDHARYDRIALQRGNVLRIPVLYGSFDQKREEVA